MRSINYFGYEVFENGDVLSKDGKKKLKLGKDLDGYYKFNLHNHGRSTAKVHRLVAILFVPNPENKPCTNHKDGVKTNNWYWNLEWCTVQENTIHAYKNKLQLPKRGADQIQSIAVIQYDLQGNFIAEYGAIKEAERMTGVDNSSISRVLRGTQIRAGKFLWSKKLIPG